MMRRMSKLLLSTAIVLATLSSFEIQAQDQASPPGVIKMLTPGPSRIVHMSMRIFSVLNNEKVQKELELTKDQKIKVTNVVKESTAAVDNSIASLTPGLNSKEMETKMAELSKDTTDKLMAKLGEILQPKQLQRFKEIQIQAGGPVILLSPDMIKELEISEEQQKEMKAMNDAYQEKMKEAAPAVISMQGTSPEDMKAKMAEMQEKPRKMRQIFGDFLLKVLTQAQRDKFDKMQGAKIDIDLSASSGQATSGSSRSVFKSGGK
jgi:hypothetical protein